MRGLVIACAGGALLATAAHAGYDNSIDRYGCWDALTASGQDCLAFSSGSSLEIRNRCNHRILIRYCLKDEHENMFRVKRTNICRETSINGNARKSVGTPNFFTGQFVMESTGSTSSGADDRCAKRSRMGELSSLKSEL